jgi:hypothetical protein
MPIEFERDDRRPLITVRFPDGMLSMTSSTPPV